MNKVHLDKPLGTIAHDLPKYGNDNMQIYDAFGNVTHSVHRHVPRMERLMKYDRNI